MLNIVRGVSFVSSLEASERLSSLAQVTGDVLFEAIRHLMQGQQTFSLRSLVDPTALIEFIHILLLVQSTNAEID